MILPVKDRSEEDGENPMRYLTGILSQPPHGLVFDCIRP